VAPRRGVQASPEPRRPRGRGDSMQQRDLGIADLEPDDGVVLHGRSVGAEDQVDVGPTATAARTLRRRAPIDPTPIVVQAPHRHFAPPSRNTKLPFDSSICSYDGICSAPTNPAWSLLTISSSTRLPTYFATRNGRSADAGCRSWRSIASQNGDIVRP